MANKTVVAVEVKLDGGEKTSQTVGSIKQQLREANAELIAAQENFGEYSNQALNAARKVANLKDAIGDAKETADLFDPGKKFQALTNVLNVAAGGFAALQGAQALFGAESEDLQKTLAKVQGALALSQGLSQISDAAKDFQRLGTVMSGIPIIQKAITLGQKAWNAAMAANPIGAILLAITALIGGIVALTQWFAKSSAAARENAAAVAESKSQLESLGRAYDALSESMEADTKFTLEMAKAQGKSKEEVRKLEIANINSRIALDEKELSLRKAALATANYTLETLKAKDADEEQIKAQEENIKEAQKSVDDFRGKVQKGYETLRDTNQRFRIEDTQAETDANKKKADDAKAAADKRAADAKAAGEKLLQANKQANDNIRKLNQEIALENEKDERKRAELQLKQTLENSLKELNASGASAKLIAEQKLLIEQKYALDVQALKEKFDAEDRKKADEKEKDDMERRNKARQATQEWLQKMFDDRATMAEAERVRAERVNRPNENDTPEQAVEKINRLEQAKRDAENAAFQAKLIQLGNDNAAIELAKQQHETNLTTLEDEAAKARKEIAQKEFEAKQSLLGAIAGELNKFADVVGKETVMGKALAAAGALVDTYKGIAAGVKLGFPKAIPAVAFAAATGFKAVKNILAVKVPGKSGSSGGSTGAAPSVTAPVAPVAETTRLDQQSINAVGNAAGRAFVLESDVSSNQERIRRLNRAARIN